MNTTFWLGAAFGAVVLLVISISALSAWFLWPRKDMAEEVDRAFEENKYREPNRAPGYQAGIAQVAPGSPPLSPAGDTPYLGYVDHTRFRPRRRESDSPIR